jgi:phage repressor protein C with HTH and peptisase S24 domain
MVLIKRLVRRSAHFVELAQFNPPMTFRVPSERVAAIHRVRGRL